MKGNMRQNERVHDKERNCAESETWSELVGEDIFRQNAFRSSLMKKWDRQWSVSQDFLLKRAQLFCFVLFSSWDGCRTKTSRDREKNWKEDGKEDQRAILHATIWQNQNRRQTRCVIEWNNILLFQDTYRSKTNYSLIAPKDLEWQGK